MWNRQSYSSSSSVAVISISRIPSSRWAWRVPSLPWPARRSILIPSSLVAAGPLPSMQTPLTRPIRWSVMGSFPRSVPSMQFLLAISMPPMPPFPTPVSAFASPPFLLPTITVSPSFPHRLTSRSIGPFTNQDVPLLLPWRSSNKGPKPHSLSTLLFITLCSLLNSSLNLLLSNRRLICIIPYGRSITERFTKSTFFGFFDRSYFLFASFGGGQGGGGRVAFGVPIQISVLLPTAHGCGMLVASVSNCKEEGDVRAMRL